MKHCLQLFAFFTVLLFAASCNTQSTKDDKPGEKNNNHAWKDADKIVYGFHDASVAPQYHRSYSITVTQDSLQIANNSYADVLLKETRPFSIEKFETVKASFSQLKKKGEIDEKEIPAGGTSESISFFSKRMELFHGEDYGGSNRNFSGADISLSYLVPDLAELISKTRKEEQQDESLFLR